MSFQIGFVSGNVPENTPAVPAAAEATAPRASVVRVRFPKGMAFSYYNEEFDLQEGDRVYVEGKFAGECGRVVEVSHNFKIKRSEYKRVIAKLDTAVTGDLYFAESYLLSFERGTLPPAQCEPWFCAPESEEDEYLVGAGGEAFALEECERVFRSVLDGRLDDYGVPYLALDGTKGRAVVEGSRNYAVEFTYQNGEVSGLVCPCFETGVCYHQAAAMLVLRELLRYIEEHYAAQYGKSGFFAAIRKDAFFGFAVDGKARGRLSLG